MTWWGWLLLAWVVLAFVAAFWLGAVARLVRQQEPEEELDDPLSAVLRRPVRRPAAPRPPRSRHRVTRWWRHGVSAGPRAAPRR